MHYRCVKVKMLTEAEDCSSYFSVYFYSIFFMILAQTKCGFLCNHKEICMHGWATDTYILFDSIFQCMQIFSIHRTSFSSTVKQCIQLYQPWKLLNASLSFWKVDIYSAEQCSMKCDIWFQISIWQWRKRRVFPKTG